MDQVHKRTYEMVNTRGYEALHKLIEEEFLYLNEDEIKRVYESVMECVNLKITYVILLLDSLKQP